MNEFTFTDRPDNQRIQLVNSLYSEVNPEVVELFIDFQWTYRNMQNVYDSVLDKNDLSESRFIILMFLKQAPDKKLLPSIISEKLGATKATVSKLLKAMEAKEWVSKKASKNDKRSVSIELTEKGDQILNKFLPINFNVTNVLFHELSSEDMHQLSYLLNKIKVGTNKYIQEMEK